MRVAYSGFAGASFVNEHNLTENFSLEELAIEGEDEWCRLVRFFIRVREKSDEFKKGFLLNSTQAFEFDRSYQEKLRAAYALIKDGKKIDVKVLKKTLVDFLNGHIGTEAAYTAFEDNVLQLGKFHGKSSPAFAPDVLYPRDVLDAIRRHGKFLFGVDRLEEEIEKHFDVEIETESFAPFMLIGNLCFRGAMHYLKQDFQELNKLLAFIPEEMRHAAHVKKIYLTTETIVEVKSLDDRDPKTKYLGGVALPGHFVYSRRAKIFFHEFFHCLDISDGMLYNDLEYISQSYGLKSGLKLYRDLFVDKITKAISRGKGTGDKKKTAKSKNNKRPAGFSSRYGYDNFSKSGMWTEDQADLAAEVIYGSLGHYLYREIDPAGWQNLYGKTVTLEEDSVLVAKIKWLKKFLYKKSGGLWNDAFWLEFLKSQNLSQFGDAYWKQKREFRKTVASELPV